MNQIKEAGVDKLKSTEKSRKLRKTGNNSTTATDAAADDDLKELPSYIIACFKTLTENLLEREDNKRQELREEIKNELRVEFLAKLSEKDD